MPSHTTPSALRRGTAMLTATAILVAGCTTQMQRIGADDGTDACRPQLVALDSTGNFFGEDIVKGAVTGAVVGGLIGGLASGNWRGAAIGAAAGGVAGGVGGYLAARQRQAQDQAALNASIAGDLYREVGELEKTQIAFDQLMDCRFGQAQQIRADYRSGRIPRAQAEAAMAVVRGRAQRDLQLAQSINERIGTRGAEFDTAVESVAPGTKAQVASRYGAGGRPMVTLVTAQPVALRLRPDPRAPEIGQVTARQSVQVKPAAGGYAMVVLPDGQRGYVPASQAFGARGASMRAAAPPPAAQNSDVRTLAASTIVRRDNFSDSVSTAQTAIAGGGFELAPA
ncbi:hypothetical protein M0638_00435 [Roseomonas sp. NAR14]|uniref:YMGG-like Gly-zipper domain-containing protein n=1 Tax=Roseomonas acroporae TaxID=2937791 RepID=A0A9X1Y4E9_9PROT|nr:YMGG-like glycine zipper-containing protein [Roseomonas acroporae]MCK8782845.1 hypothetical protein [Roseomonas acroporae]